MLRHILAPLLASSAALAITTAPVAALPVQKADPTIARMLKKVSPTRLMDRVDRLVSFHTRHTMSETESDERGIGAARRWIEDELHYISAECDDRLQVLRHTFEVEMGRGSKRRLVELVNVYGFLPGTCGDPLGRTYVVSGHYDSIPANPFDAEAFAPGADDDASGTAVVLELAEVMSRQQFEANLIFVLVPGEEQGLYGSGAFAQKLAKDGINVEGMITNDIVGGMVGGNGLKNESSIRCFSAAAGLHSLSREWARTLAEATALYDPKTDIKLIFRLDRFGRGGDHKPFDARGIPAIRMTEANENYARQHKYVRGDEGDLPEFVSGPYMARVARSNLAALAQVSRAPAPPKVGRLRAAMSYDTQVSWKKSPSADVAGYIVVWRSTTSPVWEERSALIEGTSFTVPLVTADNCFFGVRAVSAQGHESRTAYPDNP